ncbi:hypothetical protein GCM10027447_28040 [Glycomyces halotolerans]
MRWQPPPPKTPELELVEELVVSCLDQVTWRPIVRPRIIGLGLAACLLGQLIAFRQVQVVDRALVMSYTSQPPKTVLALEIWEAVKAESSPQPVKTWLRYLAERGMGSGGIFTRVVDRMVSRGHITVERHGILGRRLAYVPANRTAAAWPLARVRQGINRDDSARLSGRDAFLAGLLTRMGLGSRLVDTDAGKDRLRAAVAELEPAVQSLLDHLDAAVGEAAMTQRH